MVNGLTLRVATQELEITQPFLSPKGPAWGKTSISWKPPSPSIHETWPLATTRRSRTPRFKSLRSLWNPGRNLKSNYRSLTREDQTWRTPLPNCRQKHSITSGKTCRARVTCVGSIKLSYQRRWWRLRLINTKGKECRIKIKGNLMPLTIARNPWRRKRSHLRNRRGSSPWGKTNSRSFWTRTSRNPWANHWLNRWIWLTISNRAGRSSKESQTRR